MTLAMRPSWPVQQAAIALGTFLALVLVLGAPPVYLVGAVLAAGAAVAVLRYPVAGFCLVGFSVPWGSSLTVTAASFPVTPTDLIVALIGFVWVVRLVTVREHPWRNAPWFPYVVLFISVIVLSASQATDVKASEREIVKWLELATVFLAGTTFLRTRTSVEMVIAAIVLAGVSQALLGFIQSGLSLGPASFANQRFLLRAYGTFDQPNPYAGYLNLVLPMALAMGLLYPSRRGKTLYLFAAAGIFGAVLASESRGALLAGFVAVVVMVAALYRTMLRAAAVSVLGIVAGSTLAAFNLLPLSILDRILTPLGLANVTFNDVNDTNFSTVERAAHWLAGVRMFDAHPLLGVGIGNYSAAYPAFHPRGWYASLDHAHNYYINIAAEAGVFGLAAYLLLVGSALWYSFVALRAAREPVFRAAGLGVTGALVATSFHNIFDVLFVHGITTLLGLLMALVFAPFAVHLGNGANSAQGSSGS